MTDVWNVSVPAWCRTGKQRKELLQRMGRDPIPDTSFAMTANAQPAAKRILREPGTSDPPYCRGLCLRIQGLYNPYSRNTDRETHSSLDDEILWPRSNSVRRYQDWKYWGISPIKIFSKRFLSRNGYYQFIPPPPGPLKNFYCRPDWRTILR